MYKLNVAAISKGHSIFTTDVSVEELDLLDCKEFTVPVHIHHDFNRVGDEVFIKTSLTTKMNLTCDICLDQIHLDLNETVDIIVTPDSELVEREKDIYRTSDSTTEVDITDSLRQSLLLAIPFKKKCKEDCKGLCPTCGKNLNKGQCSCVHKKVDPRWDALKNISFDNDKHVV